MSRHKEYEELLAIHTLGALEPEEAMDLLTHLDKCSACQEELPGLQATADSLAWAAEPVEPPAELRDKVLRAARQTRQEISFEEMAAPVSAEASATPAAPVVEAQETPGATVTALVPRQRSYRVLQALSAACLVVVVGFSGWTMGLKENLGGNEGVTTVASQVENLAGDPQTLHASLSNAEGAAHGTLMVGDGKAAMLARDLPPLEEGYQYVLWEQVGLELNPLQGFTVDEGGDATLVTSLSESKVDALAVSLEADGALPKAPTTQVVSGLMDS